MNQTASEFTYKVPRGFSGARPGAHRSQQRGAGINFAAHARLFDQPDPRRLDLRASISSVSRQWLVRTHQQRSSAAVSVIVDVSASMHFGHPFSKIDVASDFVKALGHSAYRFGDAVQMMAFDAQFRDDVHLPPTRGRGAGVTMEAHIRHCRVHDRHQDRQQDRHQDRLNGLNVCIERVAASSGLVFLASDFHFDLANLQPLLDQLSSSLLIPIVIWHSSEIHPPQQTGLLSLRDASSGRARHLWMRSSIRQQWRNNVADRRAALTASFAQHDIQPFFTDGVFSADALTRYFMEQVT